MKAVLWIVCVIGWLAVLPGTFSASAEDVQIRTGEACEGLSSAACCVQTVQTHTFRTHGETLPRRAEVVAKLACQAQDKRVKANVCRQLLIARGLPVAAAKAQCEAKQAVIARCREEPSCMACARDVGELGYRQVAGLCWAAVAPVAPARR